MARKVISVPFSGPLLFGDLTEGLRVAVRCSHGGTLAIVHVVKSVRPNSNALVVQGWAELPDGTRLEERALYSPQMLGAPWDKRWMYVAKPRGFGKTCELCVFTQPPKIPPWPKPKFL